MACRPKRPLANGHRAGLDYCCGLISKGIINLLEGQRGTIATVNLFNSGDGVVSADSQRVNAVLFFQRHPDWV